MGELDAKLMRAARLRTDFEPGQVAVDAATLEVQQRLPRAGACGSSTSTRCVSVIFAQPIFERAGVLLDRTFDDGPVNLFDGPFAKLLAQPRRRLAGAGEQKDAGDGFVEAMDDAEKDFAGLFVLVLEIFLDSPIERLLLRLESGHR